MAVHDKPIRMPPLLHEPNYRGRVVGRKEDVLGDFLCDDVAEGEPQDRSKAWRQLCRRCSGVGDRDADLDTLGLVPLRRFTRENAQFHASSGHLTTLSADRNPLRPVRGRIHVWLLGLPLCFRAPELGRHRLDRPGSWQHGSQVR